MKKVLLITYYWPPSGGSGVQRWLNFTKYLSDFDIEPIVYTVSNPNYAIQDLSLKAPKNIKVVRQPIWEPYRMASFFSGKNSKETSAGFLEQSPSLKGKILNYIRANYFIPDARKYWVKPSVNFLKKYLKENRIDTVITTGPPHSLHLIGLKLQSELKVKWIADFRDPWTQIDYFHNLPFTKKSKQKHFNLEKLVAKKADTLLVVGKTMQDFYARFNKKVNVISNGFDTIKSGKNIVLDKKFSLTHIGLLNADRNADMFWEIVGNLMQENADFKSDVLIKLVGTVAPEVRQSIAKYNLTAIVEYTDYLPHNKVIAYQQQTQILLLFVNKVPSAKGILTGKIFEYLQAKRPILAIGPTDGDLAAVLQKTKAGIMIDFDDTEKLKQTIIENYNLYKSNNLKVNSKHINDYHVKNICAKLAEIIKS